MKRTVLFFATAILTLNAGLFSALSRHVVSYEIKARLVPDTKTVEGHEVLTWTNDSKIAVSELQFHLYMNAFKNNRTTFMKESGGMHRGFKPDQKNWGYIHIQRIALRDGADLTETMSYLQPDDQNRDDQTVLRVTLPSPVEPQQEVTLVIDFQTKLPKVFARSGFAGNFFMVGQWFPKIGVLWNNAWNCHQYHSNSEFFADYGTYQVELTVPDNYVVGATGKRTAETKNADGTKTYVHVQEDVHDFAWTACPDFVEFREKYRLSDPPVETEMILLVHRSHLRSKDRYAQALRNGLEFYSKNYGAYPYETITLVDPAPGAMSAGGMEYPTLFTAGTTSWLPQGIHMPEMVTIHEFGHGYWYGIVGSNEFEEAWLDEGINSYSEVKAMNAYYGEDRSMIDCGGVKIGDLVYQRTAVIGSSRFDPIVKKSWEYISRMSYALNVYSKAALMMLTLERWLGEDVMSKIMKAYFERWKFRHPTTSDFVQVAEEVSGQDLDWFFNQALYSPDKLDYGISDLKAEEINEPDGVFDGKKEQPPDKKAAQDAESKAKMYRNVVVVARFGEWVFPQDIVVIFADGHRVQEAWDGRDRWKRFVYVRPVKVVSAEVDPEHKLVLDANYLNNSRVLKPRKLAVIRAGLEFMHSLQGLLSLISL